MYTFRAVFDVLACTIRVASHSSRERKWCKHMQHNTIVCTRMGRNVCARSGKNRIDRQLIIVVSACFSRIRIFGFSRVCMGRKNNNSNVKFDCGRVTISRDSERFRIKPFYPFVRNTVAVCTRTSVYASSIIVRYIFRIFFLFVVIPSKEEEQQKNTNRTHGATRRV